MGRAPQRPSRRPGQIPKVRGRPLIKLARGPCGSKASNDQQQGGVRSDATVVGRGPVAFAGRLGQCAAAHSLHALECPREVWPHGDFFFFLLKKEPMVIRELVRFGPSNPVEAVKTCALVG